MNDEQKKGRLPFIVPGFLLGQPQKIAEYVTVMMRYQD